MDNIFKLAGFVSPFWKRAALARLTALVFMDLAIPPLVQRIIDQRIGRHDQGVVIRTPLLMLGILLLASSSGEFHLYLSRPLNCKYKSSISIGDRDY